MSDTTIEADTLPQPDRFCDEPSDSPYWNESAWFSLSKPEERLHGLIQHYFRPKMGMLNGGPVIWDQTGTFQWNCLHYNWSHLQAMPEGAAKFDMRARNSLSVRVLEPTRRYKIDYDKDGLWMDLTWEAIAPIHILSTGDAGQRKTAQFHLEQAGRMTGAIRIEAREIAIDCFSMRDTSYGPRDYESLATGGYFWGIADGAAFHAIAMGDGDTQRVIGGFLWRDGRMESLAEGTRTTTRWGRHGPAEAVFEATDVAGRALDARQTIDEGLVFTGYTDHSVVWSLSEWDVDGVTYWGDNQEFTPAARFRAIARGELAPGGAR